MSIKVMTLVWDRFPGSGSELLALLALADWCSDDGGSLYPSIATLAAKIRVSESQARRILHGLIGKGFIEVVGNERGGPPGTTRDYRFIVQALRNLPVIEAEMSTTGRTCARGRTDARGSMDARDGSHGCAETGSTHDTQTVTGTVNDPLHPVEHAKPEKPKFDQNSGKIVGLPESVIEKWRVAFPAVDVAQEIAKAEAWLLANPSNAKSNYLSFLNRWLTRAQDRAPRVGSMSVSPRANGRPSMNSFDTSTPADYEDFFNHRRSPRQ